MALLVGFLVGLGALLLLLGSLGIPTEVVVICALIGAIPTALIIAFVRSIKKSTDKAIIVDSQEVYVDHRTVVKNDNRSINIIGHRPKEDHTDGTQEIRKLPGPREAR